MLFVKCTGFVSIHSVDVQVRFTRSPFLYTPIYWEKGMQCVPIAVIDECAIAAECSVEQVKVRQRVSIYRVSICGVHGGRDQQACTVPDVHRMWKALNLSIF